MGLCLTHFLQFITGSEDTARGRSLFILSEGMFNKEPCQDENAHAEHIKHADIETVENSHSDSHCECVMV